MRRTAQSTLNPVSYTHLAPSSVISILTPVLSIISLIVLPFCPTTRPIVEEAIARTREARLYIMDEVMSKAIAEPRKEVNEWAPKIEQITIEMCIRDRVISVIADADEKSAKVVVPDYQLSLAIGKEVQNARPVSYTHLEGKLY